MAHFQNGPLRVGGVFAPFQVHVPVGFCAGDFLVGGRTFGEQAGAVGGEMRVGEGQKFVERGEGAGGDEGGWRGFGVLDTGVENFCRGREFAGGVEKEGALALVGFDQSEGDVRGDGEDQAGKAGAGAEIDGVRRGCGDMRDEGEGILDMARPEVFEIGAADEVDAGGPADDEGFVGAEFGVGFGVMARGLASDRKKCDGHPEEALSEARKGGGRRCAFPPYGG